MATNIQNVPFSLMEISFVYAKNERSPVNDAYPWVRDSLETVPFPRNYANLEDSTLLKLTV